MSPPARQNPDPTVPISPRRRQFRVCRPPIPVASALTPRLGLDPVKTFSAPPRKRNARPRRSAKAAHGRPSDHPLLCLSAPAGRTAVPPPPLAEPATGLRAWQRAGKRRIRFGCWGAVWSMVTANSGGYFVCFVFLKRTRVCQPCPRHTYADARPTLYAVSGLTRPHRDRC